MEAVKLETHRVHVVWGISLYGVFVLLYWFHNIVEIITQQHLHLSVLLCFKNPKFKQA